MATEKYSVSMSQYLTIQLFQNAHYITSFHDDLTRLATISFYLATTVLCEITRVTRVIFFPHFFAKMTASQEGNSKEANSAIHSSLVRARDIIVQLLNGVATTQQSTTPTTNSQLVAMATNAVPNEPYNASNNRAIDEHRRLFGFSGHSVGINVQSSVKRNRHGGKSTKKMKIATWTRSFVCLSKKSQFSLPTPQERYELKCAGLGEKKITIEVDGKGFDTLYKVLQEQFPPLSNAGGIDLLRTGFGSKSKTLEVIPVPPGCSTYSIEYLKDVLQQAKCYVRPIQRDLPNEIPVDSADAPISEVR